MTASKATGFKDQELLDIDGDIETTKNYLWVWAVICGIGYLLLVILWKTDAAPNAPSFGGTLGDYFGGLLNPVVAFAAFYWLTKGVRIQKQELSETKQALSDQVESARVALKINALSAMINTHTSDIAYRRDHLEFLMAQRTKGGALTFYSMRGKSLNNLEFDALVADLNKGIEVRAKQRVKFAGELRALLNETWTEDERKAFKQVTVDDNPDNDGAP